VAIDLLVVFGHVGARRSLTRGGPGSGDFPSLLAQTTVGTGSIVGTVSDPSSAVISGANVTITNVAAGQVIELTTNSSGCFNSGALIPGNYKAQVSAKGFGPWCVR
jgi:hypothetical protein